MGMDCFIPMTHILTREVGLTAFLRGKMNCYFRWMHLESQGKQKHIAADAVHFNQSQIKRSKASSD